MDFRGFDKETGRGWSCLQDSLAMAGKLLGMASSTWMCSMNERSDELSQFDQEGVRSCPSPLDLGYSRKIIF